MLERYTAEICSIHQKILGLQINNMLSIWTNINKNGEVSTYGKVPLLLSAVNCVGLIRKVMIGHVLDMRTEEDLINS